MDMTDITPELEAVARAICKANGLDPDADCRYDSKSGVMLDIHLEQPENWRDHVTMARAALLAIREPTEGMKDYVWNEGISTVEFGVMWPSVIDHILGEGDAK
jgi:hypothetical protein